MKNKIRVSNTISFLSLGNNNTKKIKERKKETTNNI